MRLCVCVSYLFMYDVVHLILMGGVWAGYIRIMVKSNEILLNFVNETKTKETANVRIIKKNTRSRTHTHTHTHPNRKR